MARKHVYVIAGISIVAVITVILLLAYQSTQPDLGNLEPALGDLEVYVKDWKDNPIDGAALSISGPQNESATVDISGFHNFTGIPEGNYSIVVSKAGYNLNSTPVIVNKGQTVTTSIKLYILREFTLTAHMLNLTVWAFNDTVPGPTIAVNEGDMVRITISVPEGDITHRFNVTAVGSGQDPNFIALSKTIFPGETDTVQFIASPADQFKFFCPLPGHETLGMRGEIVIVAQ